MFVTMPVFPQAPANVEHRSAPEENLTAGSDANPPIGHGQTGAEDG